MQDLQKKPLSVIEREAAEAAVHRANLLRSANRKRRWSSSNSGEDQVLSDTGLQAPISRYHDEASKSPVAPDSSQQQFATLGIRSSSVQEEEEDTIKRIRRMRKKRNSTSTKQQLDVRAGQEEMSNAVKGLGDSVALVAKSIESRNEGHGSTKTSELEFHRRLEKLEKRLDFEAEERKKEVEEAKVTREAGNEMLIKIMSKLNEM
jgi:hypothetical protein